MITEGPAGNTTVYSKTSNSTSLGDDQTCKKISGEEIKCTIVVVVKRVAASSSIVGCILVLGIIILFKLYRALSQRMILHLSVASLFTSSAILIEDVIYTSTFICKLQGAMLTFFIWECFLWTTLIMLSLYFRVVYGFDLRRFEMVLTLVLWIIPIIPTSLGFIYDLYAPAGAWCWMKNDVGWRLGTVYIWKIISVFIFIVVSVHILIAMHRQKARPFKDPTVLSTLNHDIRILRIYPIIYFVMNIFSIIVRIHNSLTTDEDQHGYIFTTLLLQNIADPLYGATLAMAYVLDRDTRTKINIIDIRTAIGRCCNRHKGRIKEFPVRPQIL